MEQDEKRGTTWTDGELDLIVADHFDRRNRQLGMLGEKFVLDLERSALRAAGCAELADKVRWVSDQDGDGAGYDIASYDRWGKSKLIEVKTTNGAAQGNGSRGRKT